ncbi:hypothetical protein BEN71_17665 [Acinetobacter wuhouensis]|uniref:Uncharacterized protein n=1 Tax=Acinetobacter wuhouensis TaxID=1879050 RepID=A0A385CAB6_9GAMM|nr:hypothetical protein BEN71_17665 [Acinetobacter wuhouensis]RZG78250.1 hypothetical protein EXE09_01425 [Acinetobacter sp. WCHAc060025]RZG81514.1 hypothetical protein EXE10_12945 [Acinetobacter sp. WCHAc060033]AYO52930.1 hypothetical protein CDG68_04270 [Acinetobacter wuhouensis]RZG47217.1 hypothetical protein EXU28_06510 [Acinetobacter wuhouensis]
MQQDQKELFEVLEKQRQQQAEIDRILKIVLPILAFLLCVICANYNWQSTVGTLIVLVVAFLAVGIKRMNLYLWLAIIAIYCLVDIYLSYGTIQPSALGRQMGTMLTFTGIVGISRPYIDGWFIRSKNNQIL